MRILERVARVTIVLCLFGMATYVALTFGIGGLWRGFEAAHAVANPGRAMTPYEPTRLSAVMPTLETISKQYVTPGRVDPRQMFLSALNQVQLEVAQVIILHDENSPRVKVRVYDAEREFRVDNVQGPWDVAARLREVFAFLQEQLRDTDVDLRELEYAACNGMLRTLDPHSVFMSPEEYREMNLSTSGHFGGLGIVISIRDQALTVMRPMPETPAGRAGLKRLDRITKINNESTLNMPLDDAVGRLRGQPGTKVTVWVHRDGQGGWQGSRPFELTREVIRIHSVDSRPLGGGVGYARIKQFQASTDDELGDALAKLAEREPLRGLVLDLRENPGGLLEQAAKVADRFLDHGVIVATVGHSEGRDEKQATRRGTEASYPIVVLVNGSSASASEIVAGALKNLDRAVVVGQRTFGKGTVQLVFPQVTPDGAALKLTIAEYLTPGDFSIQGVGVTPDVELDPMTADPLEMDLYRSDRFGERDLSQSLDTAARRSREVPYFKLRYNLPEPARLAIIERGGDIEEDEFELDFPVRFARDLVEKLPRTPRPAQLQQAKATLEKVQDGELGAIASDLARLGVDWTAPPKNAPPGPRASEYDVVAKTDRIGNSVTAGEAMSLEVAVTNRGQEPIYQLRAVTKSDGGYYNEKELIFGKVMPGQTLTARAPLGWCEIEGRKPGSSTPVPQEAKRVCRIPKNAVTRQDVVTVRFFAEGGEAPRETSLRPTVQSLPRPVFAYTYQIVDSRTANGDGQVARGEGVTIYLTLKNVGTGRSYETQANLRNLTGDGLLLHNGRFDVSGLQPGEQREVAFTFDVLPALQESVAKVEVSVADRDLDVLAHEKLDIPVTRNGLFVTESHGNVAARTDGVMVRAQPSATAPEVGRLAQGTVCERLGTFGEFTKLRLLGDRFGFVETRALAETKKAASPVFAPLLQRSPPVLELGSGELAIRGNQVHIEGVAKDPDGVLDTYIFVGATKVYYQSAPKGQRRDQMIISHDVKLQPGINVITVVARENEDSASRVTRVVRRDGPRGELLPTPKKDEFAADWVFSGKVDE
ncbi:MAG: PDZ domain-containing protein [Polyangiaceae bacterium]|nr:PDZ domain-containing protein [Polyangiaceae bacterium]